MDDAQACMDLIKGEASEVAAPAMEEAMEE